MKPLQASDKDIEEELVDASPNTAIAKAFHLLDLIVKSPHPLALSDLAAISGMPKPSVHRMLLQLEAIGMVKRDPLGKRFGVGDDLNQLAINVVDAVSKAPPVREIMQGLVDALGESCNLGILDGKEILYLERIECDRPLRMHLRAGSRVPVHCTAVGKLFLAHMAERRRRRMLEGMHLTRFTPNTLTDPEALLDHLRTIRKTGVSTNREEYAVGVIGAAVPVMTEGGTLVAGLAVHAPNFRMSVEQAEAEAVPRLREAAQRICAELDLGEAEKAH